MTAARKGKGGRGRVITRFRDVPVATSVTSGSPYDPVETSLCVGLTVMLVATLC